MGKTEINLITGKFIRRRRKQMKLYQRELAEKVGVSHQHISMVENGSTTISWELLHKILKHLGVKKADLVVETDKKDVIKIPIHG